MLGVLTLEDRGDAGLGAAWSRQLMCPKEPETGSPGSVDRKSAASLVWKAEGEFSGHTSPF